MVRVGFYLPRRNHLKMLGPMIAMSCRRSGHEIHVFTIGWATKEGQEIDPSEIETLFGGIVHVHVVETASALCRKIVDLRLLVVFSVSTRLQQIGASDAKKLMTETQSRGTKWLAVPHLNESELQLLFDWPNCLPWDAIGVFSSKGQRFLRERLGGTDASDEFLQRIFVTGCPEFDDLPPTDKTKIRVDFELPADEKLIVIAPPNLSQSGRFPDPSMRFNEYLFRRDKGSLAAAANGLMRISRRGSVSPYRDYLTAIREFADNNDALIVAKIRSKTPRVEDLSDFVDFVIGDKQFFPYTTRQLLSVSDAYFGFYSAMAIEAVVEGLMPVTFEPYPVAPVHSPSERELKRVYDTGEDGAWNTAGSAIFIRGYLPEGVQFLKDLVHRKLSDFRLSAERKTKYLQRHLHFVGCSSERFFDVLTGELP